MAKTFTAERRRQAGVIFEQFDEQLRREKAINTITLEFELRRAWDAGYQTIKSIMIDILQNHPEYEHLAAYYAEYSNPAMMNELEVPFYEADHTGMCVISEFQRPLAAIYGASSWFGDKTLQAKRREYWENAFSDVASVESVSR